MDKKRHSPHYGEHEEFGNRFKKARVNQVEEDLDLTDLDELEEDLALDVRRLLRK